MNTIQLASYIVVLFVVLYVFGLIMTMGHGNKNDYEDIFDSEEVIPEGNPNNILSNEQLKDLLRIRKCEKIDVVFTWVNGSDKSFQEEIEKYRHESQKNRFNDYGTLRFSFRSVIKYVKDLRNIYLVTNGQRPSWLNTDDPRVKLVTHDEIFTKKEYLPTFNSNSIELQFVNIPDLSECFLYMNDDFFVIKDMGIDYFINDAENQSMNLYFDKKFIAPRFNDTSELWHVRSMYTNKIINEHYHPDDLGTEHRYSCHNAYFLRKTILKYIYSVWSEYLDISASHRFRNGTDTIITFMHNNVALEEGLGKSAICDTSVINWGNDHAHNMWKLKSIRPESHTLCIQDMFTNTSAPSYEKEVKDLGVRLCEMFPNKSFAEIPSEPNPCEVELKQERVSENRTKQPEKKKKKKEKEKEKEKEKKKEKEKEKEKERKNNETSKNNTNV